MPSRNDPGPTFYKGDLIRRNALSHEVEGWRRTTPEETAEWYAELGERVRRGEEEPFDCAGESKLAPRDKWFVVKPEWVLTVISGRVSAPYGYSSLPNCSLVFCPDNGETFYVSRRNFTKQW